MISFPLCCRVIGACSDVTAVLFRLNIREFRFNVVVNPLSGVGVLLHLYGPVVFSFNWFICYFGLISALLPVYWHDLFVSVTIGFVLFLLI